MFKGPRVHSGMLMRLGGWVMSSFSPGWRAALTTWESPLPLTRTRSPLLSGCSKAITSHLAFLGSPSNPPVSHFHDLGLHPEVLDLLPLGNTKPHLATVSPGSAPTSWVTLPHLGPSLDLMMVPINTLHSL